MSGNAVEGVSILKGSGDISINASNDEIFMYGSQDGQVALYNNGSKKFETGSLGVNVTGTVFTNGLSATGNISVDGTVDGRDIAADGDKLDDIEANADVTDAANVSAAGALMTTTGGTVAGDVTAENITAGDGTADKSVKAYFSDGSYSEMRGYGMQFSRDTTYLRPTSSNTSGGLNIGTSANSWGDVYINTSGLHLRNEDAVTMDVDGSGNLTLAGTVDGRDISADGANLDSLTAYQSLISILNNNVTTSGDSITGITGDFTTSGYISAGSGVLATNTGEVYWGAAQDKGILKSNSTEAIIDSATGVDLSLEAAGTEFIRLDDGEQKVILNKPVSDEINIRTSGTNDAEGSKLRLTEGVSGDMGGFVHYDALANELNIGVHATSTSDDADDADAITIGRDDANVTVNNDLGVTGDLTVGGDFNVDSLTMEGTSPSLQFNDTDSGSSAAISGDAGALTLTGDVVMGDTMKMPVDGAPASPSNGEGLIYFDSTDNEPKFHDGSSWNSFGSSYTLPAATDSVRGGIELASNTVQTVAAESVTATAGRTYGVQVNSAGQGVVNVPWTEGGGGSGVTVSASEPGSPSAGDLWFKTGENKLYVYNGTQFELIESDIPAITMHSVAAAWVAQVEANDGITLTNVQKAAISDFTQGLEDEGLDSKVKAFWVMGLNVASARRDLIAPTSQFSWSSPGTVSNGVMNLDGSNFENDGLGAPSTYGLTNSSAGWVCTVSDIDNVDAKLFNSRQDSNKVFSAMVDGGNNWAVRNGRSTKHAFTANKLDGTFVGCRNGSTLRGTRIYGASKTAQSGTTSVSGLNTTTVGTDLFENLDGKLSTMGLTIGLSTAECETLGGLAQDLAVTLGHSDLSSTTA